jgi:hypothetical protein
MGAFAKAQAKYRVNLSRLATELGKVEEIRGGLGRLERAGADKSTILHGLAIAILMKKRRTLGLDKLRLIPRELRSLAKRMRDMAGELEQTYAKEETYPYLVAVALHMVRDTDVPAASEGIPRELISQMRACADDLEAKAKEHGLNFKSIMPVWNRWPEADLVAYVHHATGDVRPHLGTICEMLGWAYHTQRIKRDFTIDRLEKVLSRHVLPRLK